MLRARFGNRGPAPIAVRLHALRSSFLRYRSSLANTRQYSGIAPDRRGRTIPTGRNVPTVKFSLRLLHLDGPLLRYAWYPDYPAWIRASDDGDWKSRKPERFRMPWRWNRPVPPLMPYRRVRPIRTRDRRNTE